MTEASGSGHQRITTGDADCLSLKVMPDAELQKIFIP